MLVEHQHAASDPTTTDLVRQSDAALHSKRPQDAAAMARMAMSRDAAYIAARLALGRALEALGRHAEAAAVAWQSDQWLRQGHESLIRE
jgi:4'-phosphopantetheinyl transferase EntD